ncbi:MAG TPA: four helix bundle protein [Candidatus Paceibacterota bacterium]
MQKLILVYKIWHSCWIHFDKLTKFGLGSKIESLFIETIQNIFSASYKNKDVKSGYLNKASDAFDLLKFLLQIMWEMEILDNKKYITLSCHLEEIGKMLGGWLKQTKTPQRSF